MDISGYLHAVPTLTLKMNPYIHCTIYSYIMAPIACLEMMGKRISVFDGNPTPVFKPITVYLLTD
jgi:hypothetical protein